jgi:predicted dehydrogenase
VCQFETDQVDQMEEEFDYFADCLLAGREPYGDPEHGLIDIQTLAAVCEASETGETIELWSVGCNIPDDSVSFENEV